MKTYKVYKVVKVKIGELSAEDETEAYGKLAQMLWKNKQESLDDYRVEEVTEDGI